MKTHIVYYSCKYKGIIIIGNYCSKNAAITAAMRKVYQWMEINTKRIEGDWSWVDSHSIISVLDLPLIDIRDVRGDSPIPQFLRYKDVLESMPRQDLERMRSQALNKKNLLEKIKNIRKR